MFWLRGNREWLIVLLSLIIQTPLAIFLGHYYDERVFMAAGYLVSSGLNPYEPFNFTGVFSHPLLTGVIPSIGYPPPWPLLLGAIFRLSYGIIPNIFLYNFAIKIPIILGNIGLAYMVRRILLETQTNPSWAHKAWLFILFNPFILLTSTAWGDFDTIVALLCCASLYFSYIGEIEMSAFSMALGVTLKPIAIPLIGLPMLISSPARHRKTIQYLLIFALVSLACYFGPFYLFGWNFPLVPNEWNAQFKMAGGMTPFNIIELFQVPTLPSGLEFLGFFWVPALIAGYYLTYRNRPKSMNDLAQKAVGLTLVFFLTRSWLSEPNINLVLPFMLLAIEPNKKSFRNFHFAWIIPLIFVFLNVSFPQLFFLPFPTVLNSLATLDLQIGTVRLVARFLIAILWQMFAWNLVVKMLTRSEENDNTCINQVAFMELLKQHQNRFSAPPFTIPTSTRAAIRVYWDSRPHNLEIASLQKGLILMLDNHELIEEGAGFGVPVVKYVNKTYFSSSAESTVEQKDNRCTVVKTFALDAIARKRIGKSAYINHGTYRFFQKLFEKEYLRRKNLSFFFNKLMEFRRTVGIQTEFVKVRPKGKISIKYTVDQNIIKIHVDLTDLEKAGCQEILILNEQGVTFFRKYTDTRGLQLFDEKIGGWEKVNANEASLSNVQESLKFTLAKQKASSLFRGWEKTKGRFAWTGLSYSLTPDHSEFYYVIKLEQEAV